MICFSTQASHWPVNEMHAKCDLEAYGASIAILKSLDCQGDVLLSSLGLLAYTVRFRSCLEF